MKDRYDEFGKDKPSALGRAMTQQRAHRAIAAKPDEVRERTIEECAKVADGCHVCRTVAKNIRALSHTDGNAAPIPPGIYFLADSDNFYSVETNRGCGNEFFRKWKDRWREFPKDTNAKTSGREDE